MRYYNKAPRRGNSGCSIIALAFGVGLCLSVFCSLRFALIVCAVVIVLLGINLACCRRY